MSCIAGRWVPDRAFVNMEAILDCVGLTDPQIRGMVLTLKPEIVLTPNGDAWDYQVVTPHSSKLVNFKSGQEIDYVSIVGKPVKATMTIFNNKLTEVHQDPGNADPTTYITREVNGDEMLVTLRVNDAESVGTYKRAA